MRRRKFSSSLSDISLTSWPITSTCPASGRINPAANFIISVFPVPVSPRSTLVSPCPTSKEMPAKTSRSSKPKRMSRSEMSASPGTLCISCRADSRAGGRNVFAEFREEPSGGTSRVMRPIIDGNPWIQVESSAQAQARALLASLEEIQQQPRQEEIRHQRAHRRNHNRCSGSAPHALRSAAYPQSAVATHGGDDQSEHHRLCQPLHHVAYIQRIDRPRPELPRAEP